MQTHSATLLTIPGFAELTPIEAAALLLSTPVEI